MAKKEVMFKGLLENELKELSLQDFTKLIKSRERRSLTRGYTDSQRALLKKLSKSKNNIKTHARTMVILPQMLGKTIKVYSGKEFIDVQITVEKLGHRLGEFVLTRKQAKHTVTSGPKKTQIRK